MSAGAINYKYSLPSIPNNKHLQGLARFIHETFDELPDKVGFALLMKEVKCQSFAVSERYITTDLIYKLRTKQISSGDNYIDFSKSGEPTLIGVDEQVGVYECVDGQVIRVLDDAAMLELLNASPLLIASGCAIGDWVDAGMNRDIYHNHRVPTAY